MKAACGPVLGLVVVLRAVGAVGEEAAQGSSPAQGEPNSTLPFYLKDRGTGVPTSMFGTYIRRGELLFYPFFEYYRDQDFEYKPEELGSTGTEDFRARYRANEYLVFLGYGITDNLAVEAEVAAISASFEKSPADPSAVPATLSESGLGDIEAQVRWRWRKEDERSPELFSYGEVVFPHNKDKYLIGTPDWELKAGTGLTRGFKWGTLTFRAAIGYDGASETPLELGEYAVEYLKRVSPAWRIYVGIEGTEDELELITEAQWHLNSHVFIKLNNGLGLTSKATDWAPEVGIVFSFPSR